MEKEEEEDEEGRHVYLSLLPLQATVSDGSIEFVGLVALCVLSPQPLLPRLLLPRHSCGLVCKASWPASARRLVPYVVYTGCNLTAKRATVFTTLSSMIIFLRYVLWPHFVPESEYGEVYEYEKTVY